MPTFGIGYFWESDPKRWDRCWKQAAAQMVAEGWTPHARKFNEVQRKRARKLWARG